MPIYWALEVRQCVPLLVLRVWLPALSLLPFYPDLPYSPGRGEGDLYCDGEDLLVVADSLFNLPKIAIDASERVEKGHFVVGVVISLCGDDAMLDQRDAVTPASGEVEEVFGREDE